MRNVSWIGLDRTDLAFEIIGETLIKPRLGPVDSEVPVSRTLKEAGVLLEDSTRNTDLILLIRY